MKLVVALALLSNAAAFMAPVQPRAAMQPLKAITTEVRSRVRDDVPSKSCSLQAAVGRRACSSLDGSAISRHPAQQPLRLACCVGARAFEVCRGGRLRRPLRRGGRRDRRCCAAE